MKYYVLMLLAMLVTFLNDLNHDITWKNKKTLLNSMQLYIRQKACIKRERNTSSCTNKSCTLLCLYGVLDLVHGVLLQLTDKLLQHKFWRHTLYTHTHTHTHTHAHLLCLVFEQVNGGLQLWHKEGPGVEEIDSVHHEDHNAVEALPTPRLDVRHVECVTQHIAVLIISIENGALVAWAHLWGQKATAVNLQTLKRKLKEPVSFQYKNVIRRHRWIIIFLKQICIAVLIIL